MNEQDRFDIRGYSFSKKDMLGYGTFGQVYKCVD